MTNSSKSIIDFDESNATTEFGELLIPFSAPGCRAAPPDPTQRPARSESVSIVSISLREFGSFGFFGRGFDSRRFNHVYIIISVSYMIPIHSVNSLVTDQLGHTKPEVTRRYAKRSPKGFADALEARRGNVISIETANSRNKG